MAPRAGLAEVANDDAAGPQFMERSVTIRGKTYTFREITSKVYDDLYKKAEINGELDSVILLKLMVTKSLVDPKMSGDELADLPFRVANEMARAVNELHFGDEPAEEDPKGA